MKRLSQLFVLIVFMTTTSVAIAQTTYTVTSTSRTGTGSITEAVDLANANPGADIIEFNPGLQVNASFPVFTGTSDTYMLNITESVTINGNGGALNGSQKWVRNDGGVNDLSKCPGETLVNTTIIKQMPGFINVGVTGQDNSGITVTINDLSIKQFNTVANVRENASLNLENFKANQIWSSLNCANKSLLEAEIGASISLKSSEFSSSVNWGIAGSVAAITSEPNAGSLNIENCLFYEINEGTQYLISWSGDASSKVNVVNSRLLGVGGIFVYGNTMETNIFNSTIVSSSTGTPRFGERIRNFSNGPLNIVATSIRWNSNYCSTCSFSPLILIESNNGIININESAIGFNFPLNTGTPFATLGGTGSGFTADAITWIEPTANQDASTLETITSQPNLITGAIGFKPGVSAQIEYNDAELVAPDVSGVLIDVINSPLINPIDNNPITTDVLGNERFDANGFRDIGAVQLALAPKMTITGSGDESVNLSWQEPLHHNNEPIVRYEYKYVEAAGGTSTIVDAGMSLNANITGLTNGTEYEFSVRAVYNEGGMEVDGPFSNGIKETPIGPLESPTPQATPGDSEVMLTWNIPDLGGRSFEVYDILWKVQGNNWIDAVVINDINQTSATISGLTNGTTYEFGIFVRASGESSNYSFVTATPDIGLSIGNFDEIKDKFLLYPNPTNDIFHIKTEDEFEAKIYSINGALIKDTFKSKKVDMSNYSPGIYLLEIQYDNKLYTKKIIKN